MQLSAKEAHIQGLRASQLDSGARLAAQDAEIKKLKDLESSSFERQKLLEQQLEEANEKIIANGRELSPREQKQCESLRELQTQLETLQASFQAKNDECSSMQNELFAANSAMSSLQSGKEKAKAEIYSLLRRVQESERWMKATKETLEKLGVNTADETFPETWNRLDALLQEKTLKSTPTAIPCGSPQSGPPSNGSIASTPRRNGGTPSEGIFQTTELIYRTQSVQRGASLPPGSLRESRLEVGGGRVNSIPDSQSTANIVPFSSIQNQLSPAHTFGQSEDATELTSMLMSTPTHKGFSAGSFGFNGTVLPSEEAEKPCYGVDLPEGSSGNPDKQSVQTEKIAKQHSGLNCGTKRKAVTFKAGAPGASKTGNKVPESLNTSPRPSAHGGLANERAPSRLNQRTYGKSQHLDSARESRKHSLEREPPRVEDDANSNIRPGSRDDDKRASASGTCRSRPERKTRRASEYFETRASPTSLASGSSRRSPATGQHAGKKWMGRSQRRGRRSRGRNQVYRSDIC